MTTEKSRLWRTLQNFMWVIAVLALISIVVRFGFDLSDSQKRVLHTLNLFIVGFFVAETLLGLLVAIGKWDFIRSHLVDFVLIILFFAAYFFFRNAAILAVKAKIIVGQAYLIGAILLRVLRLNQVFAEWRVSPAKMVVYSFLTAIAIGALLLSFPKSTTEAGSMPFIDALFTATSAVCVTGLIVVDTGKDFTLGGQLTILTLIQIGGLGIMTFSAAFSLLTGLGLGMKERNVLGSILSTENFGSIAKILSMIFLLTISFEVVGAVLLGFIFVPEMGLVRGIYQSVFHSISAFCNAGFSLFTTSLEGYYEHMGLCSIMMVLIVCGGLGFPVLIELLNISVWREKSRSLWRRFSIHTRLVLVTSAILIVAGTVLIFFSPSPESNIQWSGMRKVIGCLFQSITTRTAGFNTVRIASFGLPVILMMIALMFVGASPGSTGGGVKTTTLALLFLRVRSQLMNHKHTEVWSRRINNRWVESAAIVLSLALGFISVSVVILSITEDASLTEILFEEVSAFSTVGLSLGLTPNLTVAGKIVIIISMLVGRIGPLTMLVSLVQQREQAEYDLPEEPLLIG